MYIPRALNKERVNETVINADEGESVAERAGRSAREYVNCVYLLTRVSARALISFYSCFLFVFFRVPATAAAAAAAANLSTALGHITARFPSRLPRLRLRPPPPPHSSRVIFRNVCFSKRYFHLSNKHIFTLFL